MLFHRWNSDVLIDWTMDSAAGKETVAKETVKAEVAI
jgi:hypothetical protein